jgi:hypothetical protein
VEEDVNDLTPIACIFSYPELVCFVSALEAEGIFVTVHSEAQVRQQAQIFGLGGYRVMVSAAQRDQVIDLIDELRRGTEPNAIPEQVQSGVNALFGFGLVLNGLLTLVAVSLSGTYSLLMMFAALTTPVPMTIRGDYLDRRGRLVQMR